MACEAWTEKIDAYLDGELSEAEARAVSDHLRSCAACAAESLSRVQLKRAIQAGGRRYAADPAFRARIQNSIASRRPARNRWFWLPALATAMILLIFGVSYLVINRAQASEARLLGELADLHVAALASANPVDVVSTDRHTVKPWFEGKIPFTFNLPELKDSPFTLIGGKVSYLNQSPGAELIFRVRQHQISVFIFQERAMGNVRIGVGQNAQSFTMQTWSHNGLRYFILGDVGAADINQLRELMQSAG